MKDSITPRPILTRPAFVQANPHLRDAHRVAQCQMFAAARTAGLPTTEAYRDLMLDGINSALGLRGSQRLVSRRQMTIEEMHAISVALDVQLFGEGWKWSEEFSVTVRPMTVEVVHFEPRTAGRESFYFTVGELTA